MQVTIKLLHFGFQDCSCILLKLTTKQIVIGKIRTLGFRFKNMASLPDKCRNRIWFYESGLVPLLKQVVKSDYVGATPKYNRFLIFL